MKSITIDPTCGRENDLISFLYGEPGDTEAPGFEEHLQHCTVCKSEIASFGQLRESIGAWKQEALNGFPSTDRRSHFEVSRKRSALAALREFFDLSPLWLKSGVALAAVLFCFFAVLALGKLRTIPAPPLGKTDAIYSKQDVERMLKEALAHQTVLSAPAPGAQQSQALINAPRISRNPGKRVRGGSMQLAGNRRPLSRSEREQLAADLGLITPDDEEDFDLFGDRINR
jgi:hypothetical protein